MRTAVLRGSLVALVLPLVIALLGGTANASAVPPVLGMGVASTGTISDGVGTLGERVVGGPEAIGCIDQVLSIAGVAGIAQARQILAPVPATVGLGAEPSSGPTAQRSMLPLGPCEVAYENCTEVCRRKYAAKMAALGVAWWCQAPYCDKGAFEEIARSDLEQCLFACKLKYDQCGVVKDFEKILP